MTICSPKLRCDRFCAFAGLFLADLLGSRFVSLYLKGSFLTEQATSYSDIDLILVVDGQEEILSANAKDYIRTALIKRARRLVDMKIIYLNGAQRTVAPFVEAARLVRGKDIRNVATEMTSVSLLKKYERMVLNSIRIVRGSPDRVALPVEYPDRSDEYFGYARYGFQYSPRVYSLGFHHWLNLLLAIASHRLFLERDFVASSKHEAAAACNYLSDKHLASCVKKAYILCRGKLECQLPNGLRTQTAIREICANTLTWEKQFVGGLKMGMASEINSTSQFDGKPSLRNSSNS